MGQAEIHGEGAVEALEALIPGDVRVLKDNRIRYSVLLTDEGGIIDDLMITKRHDRLALVINAACKTGDLRHLRAKLPQSLKIVHLEYQALLALQGPKAAQVLSRFAPECAMQSFMSVLDTKIGTIPVTLSRSGYTGEDGYEISVADDHAAELARLLLAEPEVAAIGLGARDSLRLEAGLPLYGHDIDSTTSPVEANLAFTIGKRRREEGGFAGASRILSELQGGTKRLRVGIRPEGRAPAREGAPILDSAGKSVGTITSGGFGPSADAPVAMGYVPVALAAPGTKLLLEVRGKHLPAAVVSMPFVPHRYYRG
jgi:aminomethyltransferase